MIGMNATISNNVLKMLKQNGKKQNELAEALGISKQVMSNMLSGTRMINAIELHQIADFFHVRMLLEQMLYMLLWERSNLMMQEKV